VRPVWWRADKSGALPQRANAITVAWLERELLPQHDVLVELRYTTGQRAGICTRTKRRGRTTRLSATRQFPCRAGV